MQVVQVEENLKNIGQLQKVHRLCYSFVSNEKVSLKNLVSTTFGSASLIHLDIRIIFHANWKPLNINSEFQMENLLNICSDNSADTTSEHSEKKVWKDNLGKKHTGSLNSKFGLAEDCVWMAQREAMWYIPSFFSNHLAWEV